MNLKFFALDDSRVDEAFGVLKRVGHWLETQGHRQRISQTTIESYIQWQSEKANFVVTDGTEIVGLVTLRSETLEDWPEFLDLGPVLMLRALATHPDHRGRGIGEFAVRESIHQSGTKQSIFLDCVSDSLPRYYARFGFKPVARQVRTYPDGEAYDITLMQLDRQSARQ